MSPKSEKINRANFACRFVYLTRKMLLYVGDTKKYHRVAQFYKINRSFVNV